MLFASINCKFFLDIILFIFQLLNTNSDFRHYLNQSHFQYIF
jgi:hypothetical protein